MGMILGKEKRENCEGMSFLWVVVKGRERGDFFIQEKERERLLIPIFVDFIKCVD